MWTEIRSKFTLIDLLNLCFLFVLVIFFLVTYSKTPFQTTLFLLYSLVFGVIFAIIIYKENISIKYINHIQWIIPVIVFITLYMSISGLLPYYTENVVFDGVIDAWDKKVFGISPSVWMEKFTHPIITEMLYILYFVYFVLPIVLMFFIFNYRSQIIAEVSFFSILLNYYGAYIIYFFVPVVGPRFFLENEHAMELEGLFLSDHIRNTINFFEPSTLDCFPSLHTSILVLITILAAKYYEPFYRIYFVLSTVIIISLIYLRYHYLLDIIVGIIWGVVSYYVGQYVYDKFKNKFQPQFR